MQIGNIDLSILEADALDRSGLGMYAVKAQNDTTYYFYREHDGLVLCCNLTEEQAQGILTILAYVLE